MLCWVLLGFWLCRVLIGGAVQQCSRHRAPFPAETHDSPVDEFQKLTFTSYLNKSNKADGNNYSVFLRKRFIEQAAIGFRNRLEVNYWFRVCLFFSLPVSALFSRAPSPPPLGNSAEHED